MFVSSQTLVERYPNIARYSVEDLETKNSLYTKKPVDLSKGGEGRENS
jgi:hypothetical protein